MSSLPRTSNQTWAASLRTPKNQEGDKLDVTDTSARTVPISASLIEITSTVACFVTFGDSATLDAVINKDLYISPDVPRQFPWVSGDRIAAIRAGSTSGELYWHPVI